MIKLLILGSGNIEPINILCRNLRDFGNSSYQIDGINLYKSGSGNVKNEYKYLDNQYEIIQKNSIFLLPRKTVIVQFLKLMLSSQFLYLLLTNRLNLRKIFKNIRRQILIDSYKNEIIKKISEYDIVNIHWLREWQSELAPFIPSKIQVVISFWGSDLMATSGTEIYKKQYEALRRADAITMVSQEMAEITLSKFGRDLKPKIKYTYFGMTQEAIDKLTLQKSRLQEIGTNLLKEYGIDIKNFKYIIKVGYSAIETHNHIPILEEMSKLSANIIKNTLFIIPMTYDFCAYDYIEQVELKIKQNKLNGIILKNYLTHDQAKSVSVISNIMFNLRDNDAFNNSMTESLLTGAIVFNGSWLPYKLLNQLGVFYINIYQIDQLAKVFTKIISEFQEYKEKTNLNASILKDYISGNRNVLNWEKAFGL